MEIQLVISVLTTWVIKPALMLCLVWGLSWLVRKQSAAFQHFVMALGIFALVLMPLLGAVLPPLDWHKVPLLANPAQLLDEWFKRVLANYSQELTLQQSFIVFGIYGLGFFWIIYYRLLSYVALIAQTKQAQLVTDAEINQIKQQLCELLDISSRVDIKASANIKSPCVWGVIRPCILLPRSAVLWESDKKLSVLMHELGHVSRGDWWISQVVNLTCALFWFLPPLWWLANRLDDQAEIASDDLIHRMREKHVAYAESLLQFAGANHPELQERETLGMRGHSEIFYRIQAVLDSKRPRQAVALEAAQYWVIMGAGLLLFMASIQIIPLKPIVNEEFTQWMRFKFDGEKASKAPTASDSLSELVPVPIAEIRNQLFTWKSLPALQSHQSLNSWQANTIEELKVQAFKNEKPQLTLDETHEISAAMPEIQIQGYLPLDMVSPEYPASALARGIEGRVSVEFTILADGRIADPKIIARSGSTIFDRAVLSAIKKSRYQPQMFDGQPVILHGVTEDFIFEITEPESTKRRR